MSNDELVEPLNSGDKWSIKRPRLSRDTILFTAGLLGVVHETFLTPGDRQFLLIMFGAMMGLPVFLRKDEK